MKFIPQYQPATNFQQNSEYQTVIPTTEHYQNSQEEENKNSLAYILKKLQDSNALPQTLTPENIDNSIKTLVRILSALKTQQKFLTSKPIIVADEDGDVPSEEHSVDENEAEVGLGGNYGDISGTVSQSYPDTLEGGTPGRPGVDYPALSTIPPTSFNCKTQRYKGFFADTDTNCQVRFLVLKMKSQIFIFLLSYNKLLLHIFYY